MLTGACQGTAGQGPHDVYRPPADLPLVRCLPNTPVTERTKTVVGSGHKGNPFGLDSVPDHGPLEAVAESNQETGLPESTNHSTIRCAMRFPSTTVAVIGILWHLLAFPGHASGQFMLAGGAVYVVHSQNERFYLKSVPFDSETPSLRGRTTVYAAGRSEPLYVIDRAFDDFLGFPSVFLSDDGRVILCVLSDGAQETVEGLRSVTVYLDGRLLRTYTAAEVTGCDGRKQRCDLVYSNDNQVVDRERSEAAIPYRKVFKADASEPERFLNGFSLFASDAVVYVTDSRKQVHRFSLIDGGLAEASSFEDLYERMKAVARTTRTEVTEFGGPSAGSFPRLANGQAPEDGLARRLGLKAVKDMAGTAEYRVHHIWVAGTLSRTGGFEPERIEIFGSIDRQQVVDFFSTARFDARLIPALCDKWFFDVWFFKFRNRDKAVARREREAELVAEKRERERRMTLERIDGVYIPKDLGDCFVTLDTMLAEVDTDEMRALPRREDMIRYHHGLGMGLRNSWGLWRGSRLQKYFTDRGVRHPDDMSGIVLDYYYDWLRGDREGWKGWEAAWRTRMPAPPPPAPAPPRPVKKR